MSALRASCLGVGIAFYHNFSAMRLFLNLSLFPQPDVYIYFTLCQSVQRICAVSRPRTRSICGEFSGLSFSRCYQSYSKVLYLYTKKRWTLKQ